MGIAISDTHPSSVWRDATSQTPFQSRLTLELLPRRPPSPSSETCCSSLAPSGLVTNMYPDLESRNVSKMIWMLSSSSIRGESRRISVAITLPASEL